MNQNYADLLKAVSAHSVKFVVVGAYALAGHGIVRATGDIDIFIEASEENARRLMKAMVEANFHTPFTLEDLQTPDMVMFLGRRPSRIEILTGISGVEFAEVWESRTTADFGGVRYPIISLELIKKNKKASGRMKDLVDLEMIAEKEKEVDGKA